MPNLYIHLNRMIDDSYPIEIGRNLIDSLVADLRQGLIKHRNKIAVLTDSHVQRIYGDEMIHKLVNAGFNCDLFVVPSGESSKTRENKAMIEDQMLSKGYGRDSCLIALGGGMISDLGGFIAGTFCRGIAYVNYSTTLLSAADASVGGKTAVNTPAATNLIGVFHQPTKVYIDLNTWHTLPVREFRSGLAETIKHACLADSGFFEYLEMNINNIIDHDRLILAPQVCEFIAMKNCQIKYHVVEQDEKEENLRQVLNLGHTAGRAIETLSNYELLHGEAIAIGLTIQAKLAHKLGYVTENELQRIMNLLLKAGFQLSLPKNITPEKLVEKMHTDKKVRDGKIRFVFQDGIGKMKQFFDGSYSIAVEETVVYEILS